MDRTTIVGIALAWSVLLFLSAGCVQAPRGPAAVQTVEPMPAPVTPRVVEQLPGMAGHVYCYSGDYIGGCAGFNISEKSYMETIEDVQGLVVPGGGTAVRYGEWETVSSDKVVVAYTYDMYESFRGNYDSVTTWECLNPSCSAIFESKYPSMMYIDMTKPGDVV